MYFIKHVQPKNPPLKQIPKCPGYYLFIMRSCKNPEKKTLSKKNIPFFIQKEHKRFNCILCPKNKATPKKTWRYLQGNGTGDESNEAGDKEDRGSAAGSSVLVVIGARAASAALGISIGELGALGSDVASPLGALAVKAGALASTVLEVLKGLLGNLGKDGADDPVVVVLGALGSLVLGAGAGKTLGGGESLHGLDQVVELGLHLSALASLVETVALVATLNLDDTILVGLLGVLVHETTGVDAGHVGVHEGLELSKVTDVVVAAVLGQKDGKTIAGEVLDLLVPAGLDEVASAPRVIVLHHVSVTTSGPVKIGQLTKAKKSLRSSSVPQLK